MTPIEQKAILTAALLAAFADGANADAEREEVRRVAAALQGGPNDGLNGPAVLQEVLLKRATIATVAVQLTTPETRQLAFELAVGVCDADGLRNEAETRFLAELGTALALSPPQMAEPAAIADALATVPLAERHAADAAAAMPSAAGTAAAMPALATATAASAVAGAAGPVVAAVARQSDAELDKMILNYAILNGALELLPQSMASMAIIPLQMKMVYRIGHSHGYELDRGHIKDLLATVGVGLTGQYLEDIGRKLIGGLFGKAAGRMAGGLARGATGAAFSFATTYALGQLARRYYAGGRTMSTQLLKDTFQSLLGQARGMQQQYAPQIEQQARTVDVSKIVQMVRSQ